MSSIAFISHGKHWKGSGRVGNVVLDAGKSKPCVVNLHKCRAILCCDDGINRCRERPDPAIDYHWCYAMIKSCWLFQVAQISYEKRSSSGAKRETRNFIFFSSHSYLSVPSYSHFSFVFSVPWRPTSRHLICSTCIKIDSLASKTKIILYHYPIPESFLFVAWN